MILNHIQPCCSHARCILCGIQTSSMESPVLTEHLNGSLFFGLLQLLNTDLNLVYNNNNLLRLFLSDFLLFCFILSLDSFFHNVS